MVSVAFTVDSVSKGFSKFMRLSSEQRVMMAERARQKAEGYSWPEVLAPLLNLIGTPKG